MQITEGEYKNLAGKAGLVFVPSNDQTINTLSITRIYPSDEEPETQDHKIGVLHDGTRVVRQFGEWFCLEGDMDEKGRYSVRPDPEHYPEILMDNVPSVETYVLKYSKLPLAERKQLMIAGKDISRYQRSNDSGLSRIGAMPSLVAKGSTLLPSKTGIADYCDEHDAFKIDCPCSERDMQIKLDDETNE